MSQSTSSIAVRQGPLREAYLGDPQLAVTVKRVRTEQRPSTDAVHGTVVVDNFPSTAWEYGIDKKVGGLDDLPNPGHVLCAALAACLDSTIRMIAERLEVAIEHLEVEVTGEVDVRGCLAMSPAVRPGFRDIRCEVRFRPAPAADPRRAAIVVAQAERLCVTLDSLRHGVPVSVESMAPPR